MPCQLQMSKQNTIKNVHFFIPHLVVFFVHQLPFPEFFFEARKISLFILCDALRHHFEVNRSGRSTVQPRQILATPTPRVSSTDWYLSIATLFAKIRPEMGAQTRIKASVWSKYWLNFIKICFEGTFIMFSTSYCISCLHPERLLSFINWDLHT